ncbi:ribosome hibernation-promoting factor, HPF/YfiA family [Eudoraea chungangensis]|uniref:ribosome hibernation-promoting factor, HPF/YfiA family n=1 Tax=Eudoraea chungangensis TaxID=1481905 RepID=UPI0023EB55A8|nr:ribosome-associated translation inhibitor RaiA [Eudoraea chungangensis]
MTINIQYVQMPTSDSMSDIVIAKLQKLEKKYDWLIKADVFFKLENDPSGMGKICEIQLSAPGPRLFAKSNQDNFEKAAATVVKELENQLAKRKDMLKKH